MRADINPVDLLNHAVRLYELEYLSKEELLIKITEFETNLDNFGELKNLVSLHISNLRKTLV